MGIPLHFIKRQMELLIYHLDQFLINLLILFQNERYLLIKDKNKEAIVN